MPLFIVYQEYVAPAAYSNESSTTMAFHVNAIEDENGNDMTHELDTSFDYRDDQSGHALLRKQLADSLDLDTQDIELEFLDAS